MNVLAHVFFSQENDHQIIGALLADFVKGNRLDEFNHEIQQAIFLHRAIDSYTDAHPIFKDCRRLFKSEYYRFSGILLDVFYDHFLAKDWINYCPIPLRQFADRIYSVCLNNKELLGSDLYRFSDYMIRQDLLFNYQFIETIDRVFRAMSQRFKYANPMADSANLLIDNYETFNSKFRLFFAELTEFIAKKRPDKRPF